MTSIRSWPARGWNRCLEVRPGIEPFAEAAEAGFASIVAADNDPARAVLDHEEGLLIVGIDRKGHISIANSTAARMFGRAETELLEYQVAALLDASSPAPGGD